MKKLSLFRVLPFFFVAKMAVADVQVHSFDVTGYTVINDETVVATLLPFAETQFAEAAAAALQNEVRKEGAFAAKVYVIPQIDGRISLHVVEGRLAKAGVVLKSSNPRLHDDTITQLLERTLQPGTVLTNAKTERAILLANDLPGMAGSYSSIVPGDSVGDAKFELTTIAASPLVGHAYFDNFGSSYTGQYRVGGTIELNSPFKRGDKLAIGGNVSNKGTAFIYGDASLPLWQPGLRGGFTVDALDYKTSEANHLRGTSNNASLYLNHALIRSRTTNLHGELRYGRERIKDKNDASQVADRLVDVVGIGAFAEHHDDWGGAGTSKAELQVYFGDLDLGGYAPYQQTDAQTAQTEGRFTRATWKLNRLQHIKGPWQLFVETSGQVASRRLDASQGISFGGPLDLPGYHSGEVVGDEGVKLHADLRYNRQAWDGQQQWSLFYDIGRVKTHAVAVVGGFVVPGIDDNYYTMQSMGIGFHQQWKKLQLQVVLAVPVGNQIPDALLDNNKNNVKGWLQLSHQF